MPLPFLGFVGAVGMFPPSLTKTIPDITDFTNFIDCEVSPDICPMVWDSMEEIENDAAEKYCSHCEKNIHLVVDENSLQQNVKDGKCSAISMVNLEKIVGKIDENHFNNLKKRLIVSKLFMMYKRYDKSDIEENMSHENKLKEILIKITNDQFLFDSIKKDVDLKYIFDDIVPRFEDEEFKNLVSARYKTIVDKIKFNNK